jgi:hypothetical protein
MDLGLAPHRDGRYRHALKDRSKSKSARSMATDGMSCASDHGDPDKVDARSISCAEFLERPPRYPVDRARSLVNRLIRAA